MKKLIQPIIIAGLILLLFFKSCSGEEKTTTAPGLKVPAIIGKFKPKKPTQTPIPIPKKGKKPKTQIPFDDSFLQAEIDSLIALNNRFSTANDSLKAAMFANAIQLKEYQQTFDNDTIKTTVKGLVSGEIKSMAIDYVIKPRTIAPPVAKETFLRLLAGVEIGNTKTLDQLTTKANFGFQNRKGNILTFSVDTNERFYFGYTISIWNIKTKVK
jgi:hypothetical protein